MNDMPITNSAQLQDSGGRRRPAEHSTASGRLGALLPGPAARQELAVGAGGEARASHGARAGCRARAGCHGGAHLNCHRLSKMT